MRILVAHNFYRQPGGEDAVVRQESELLRAAGHDVRPYSISNDSITGPVAKFRAFATAPYSRQARKDFARNLARFAPDIVHVHNFFPLLTPSIYDACLDHSVNHGVDHAVPVVQTLHNYRTICPGALLLRKGTVCEKCVRGSPFHGLLHRCYRNSLPGSLAAARMVSSHRKRGTWHTRVARFIALTQFARKKFVEAGFPASRIVVKPNFVSSPEHPPTAEKPETGRREGALFVGRLSAEKGLETLTAAWQQFSGCRLDIVGDGPLAEKAGEQALDNIRFPGQLSPDEVRSRMSCAAFLVMPSLWYEGFPMVIVEAFSCGLPVIASRLGAMAEIVQDGKTGLHFTPGDASGLAAKVQWALSHPGEMAQMGRNARAVFEQDYTAQENYRQLMAIYQDARDDPA